MMQQLELILGLINYLKMEESEDVEVKQKKCRDVKYNGDEESSSQLLKQQKIIQHQNENIQVTRAGNICNNPS